MKGIDGKFDGVLNSWNVEIASSFVGLGKVIDEFGNSIRAGIEDVLEQRMNASMGFGTKLHKNTFISPSLPLSNGYNYLDASKYLMAIQLKKLFREAISEIENEKAHYGLPKDDNVTISLDGEDAATFDVFWKGMHYFFEIKPIKPDYNNGGWRALNLKSKIEECCLILFGKELEISAGFTWGGGGHG
jgi:hypothetical protein